VIAGLRRWLGVAAGVLLAFALFEGVARRVSWICYERHPVLGSVIQPGRDARYCREGCGTSHWIEGGFRRVAPLDPGAPVVLVLGDSFTESLMIDDDRVFTGQVEARLAASGSRIEIANAGRSGLAAPDYVELAPYYAATLAPRWTVIEVRPPDLGDDAFDPKKTHFVRDAAGGVAVVPVPRTVSSWNRFLAPLRRTSAFASFANVRLLEFAGAAREEAPLFRATRRAPAAEPAEPYPIVAELDAMAAAYGGRVTFLFLPVYETRRPNRIGETEALVASTCALRGWSCVSLRAAFPEFTARGASPFGFPNSQFNLGHMNEAGHDATAALLEAELRRLIARDLL
jgi:hypothetical protein